MSRLIVPEIRPVQEVINAMSERSIGELARVSIEDDIERLVLLGMDPDEAESIVLKINRFILGPK